MILHMASGESNSAVARRFRVSRPTVTMWRRRYRENGIAGLQTNQAWPTTQYRRRADCQAHQHGAEVAAEGQDALVATQFGGCDRPVADHRASVPDAVRSAAARSPQLRAVDRSVLHREGA